MASPLPVELFHEILQSLRDDVDTLKQCALAFSTLRYIAQQHLFSEMTIHRFPLRVGGRPTSGSPTESYRGSSIDNDETETRCTWLIHPTHSHLLSHVRHLRLQCYPPPNPSPQQKTKSRGDPNSIRPDPSFLSVLDLLPVENLDRITILRRYRDDPLSDTENVVLTLLRRCKILTELCLEDRHVPAAYLAAVAGSLRMLRVSGTEFVEHVGGGGGIPFVDSWPKLESLVFPGKLLSECLTWMVMGRGGDAGACVFPQLKNLFVGDGCRDVEVVNEVLKMCKSTLQSFVYTPLRYNFSSYPNPCFNQHGTVIKFKTPSTLKMLSINCPIMLKPASSMHPNPFDWLNHTFRRLSRNKPCSRLETVHIRFLTTEQIEKLDALFPGGFPIDMCFREFDRLLSDPARFPKLKKVYLTVGRHYLKLFRDPETLPVLNMKGRLGIIYEEASSKRFWLCGNASGDNEKEIVENLPWDGRICNFV